MEKTSKGRRPSKARPKYQRPIPVTEQKLNTDRPSQATTDVMALAAEPIAESQSHTDAQAQPKAEPAMASLGLDNQLDRTIEQLGDKMPSTEKPGNNKPNTEPKRTEPSQAKPNAEPPKSAKSDLEQSGHATQGTQSKASTAATPASQKAVTGEPTKPSAGSKKGGKGEPAKSQASQAKPSESKQPQPTASQTNESPAVVPAPAQQSNAGLYVSLVALLVALGSASFVGWQWQQGEAERQGSAQLEGQLQQLQQAQLERSQLLERRLERSEQSQNQQQASFAGQQKSLEALNKQLAQMQTQTQQALSRKADLQTELPEPPKAPNWYIAEADYLVRMASRKLWLEQDPETAFALLNDADNRIMAMDRAELLPIRQALAEDMAALSALPKVDRAGLSLKIEVLIKRIDTLALNAVYLPKVVDPQTAVEPSADLSDWRANLEKSWRAMTENFITVRRREGQVQPLIAPEHEWYLRENVRGKLMQAQLALYQGHSTAFSEALATAKLWIGDYFDQNTPAVANAIKQIDEWAQTPIGDAEPIKFTVTEPLNKLVSEELDRG